MKLRSLAQWLGRLPTKHVIIVCVALGIAIRALFGLTYDSSVPVDEAYHVAVALAQGRGFADAFRVGQGPTAHLLPISPAIAGGVYALLGVHSFAAETVLACWSVGLALGAYLLLFRAFEHLGSSRGARLLALAYACLVPVHIASEVEFFRRWEGGLAVFLAALFLERLLVLLKQPELSMRAIAGMCLLAALTFFVNPPLGLGIYACAGIACWQRLDAPRIVATVALATCALALFIVPWALRNDAVLGTPVLLRSNLGLELALANYPGAMQDPNPREQFRRRWRQIHPVTGDVPYHAMLAAGGEVAYSKQLQAATWRWMRANPGSVLRIALTHLRDLFLPERWVLELDHIGKFNVPITILLNLTGALGLTSLGLALVRRRPHWIYPAVLIGVPALGMSPFQPTPRYIYLFSPLLVYCAWDLVTRVLAPKVAAAVAPREAPLVPAPASGPALAGTAPSGGSGQAAEAPGPSGDPGSPATPQAS